MKNDFTDLVYLDAEGKTKEEVFMNIAMFARQKGLIPDEKLVYGRLLAYEKAKGTTAVGRGIACPEAPGLDDLARPFALILCRTREPIDCNAPDGAMVRVILAALSKTTKDSSYLKQAAYVTRLLRSEDWIEKFLKAKSMEEVCGLFDMEKRDEKEEPTDPTMLFKESLEWLKNNYDRYEFFMERDIVWTLQQRLREKVRKMGLPYRIVNDWPMKKGERRSLCADLVIIQNDQVRLAAEFKYEPDHEREEDFSENKLKASVVFWSGEHSVEEDIRRIGQFSTNKKYADDFRGVSIFIDEGGKFYGKREAFPGSQWEKWGKKTAVLISWSKK